LPYSAKYQIVLDGVFVAFPDHVKARRILESALQNFTKCEVKLLMPTHAKSIHDIITGTHLTFRYMLITALLAKITDSSVHARSIQTGSNLDISFDARSLCHKVWVPFEREFLDNRLGGSNEPYLNKPARFPEIAKENAVRAGSDQNLLNILFDLLEELNSRDAEYCYDAFMYAFQLIMKRRGSSKDDILLTSAIFSTETLRCFAAEYLSESYYGETCVSIVAALLTVEYWNHLTVSVHPANEAGSSSNEIGDIDIYDGKQLLYPVEVKDKSFIKADVDHAVRKSIQNRCNRLLFVIGIHSQLEMGDMKQIVVEYAEKRFDLVFLSIKTLTNALISLFDNDQKQRFIQGLYKCLIEMRAKDETQGYYLQLIKKYGFTK
jgi:hypothetical protein